MEPVVDPELLRSPDDTEPRTFVSVALAADVPKRNIGNFLKALKRLKLDEEEEEEKLQHLKKVDGATVLLCRDEACDRVVAALSKSGVLEGATIKRRVKVPGQPPLTKEQADEWNKRWWKTTYRPLQADLLPPVFPTTEELKELERFMREAIKEAKKAQDKGNVHWKKHTHIT